jgi:hypothetical protein
MKTLVIGSLKQKKVYEIIKKKFPNAYTPIETSLFKGNDKERYKLAIKKIKEADLIICEASLPSTGMGMELNEAINQNKKIIVIAKENSKISGLIKGCPKIKKIYYYKNFNKVLKFI